MNESRVHTESNVYFQDNSEELGTQYLRQCESIAYAQNVMRQKLAKHGTVSVSIANAQCDFDGSYGTYSISNNM